MCGCDFRLYLPQNPKAPKSQYIVAQLWGACLLSYLYIIYHVYR